VRKRYQPFSLFRCDIDIECYTADTNLYGVGVGEAKDYAIQHQQITFLQKKFLQQAQPVMIIKP
jgi:hypothetical protein